ncbi:hypothetical protein BASA81_000410 [Batrachochytrium salamandrivorans]|nr:hypothetical protein BASA81_000410 [Batrachochytrium salamandrivorans]
MSLNSTQLGWSVAMLGCVAIVGAYWRKAAATQTKRVDAPAPPISFPPAATSPSAPSPSGNTSVEHGNNREATLGASQEEETEELTAEAATEALLKEQHELDLAQAAQLAQAKLNAKKKKKQDISNVAKSQPAAQSVSKKAAAAAAVSAPAVQQTAYQVPVDEDEGEWQTVAKKVRRKPVVVVVEEEAAAVVAQEEAAQEVAAQKEAVEPTSEEQTKAPIVIAAAPEPVAVVVAPIPEPVTDIVSEPIVESTSNKKKKKKATAAPTAVEVDPFALPESSSAQDDEWTVVQKGRRVKN